VRIGIYAGRGLSIIPVPSENQSAERPLEVTLPDEHFRALTLTFKTPSREKLLASANRLLKAEWPLRRVGGVYERLLKTNVRAPGISRKVLENLPLPVLEGVYRELWRSFRPSEAISSNGADAGWDERLALFLLAEEMSEFLPAALVREDIRLLGQRGAPALHGYYYEGSLTRAQMITLLRGQGCRTDFLEACAPSAETGALQRAYLACRRLDGFPPWSALLAGFSSDEESRFPRLARLKAVRDLLGGLDSGSGSLPPMLVNAWQSPLTPDNFPGQFEAMCRLLDEPATRELAVRTKQARPLRTVVLVEGETEKRLLPLFARSVGLDFDALGIEIRPAGGKNHVIRLYREAADHLAVPLCVVLDDDARTVAEELAGLLRPSDRVFCFTEGEFEDTYDPALLVETVNHAYQPFPELTAQSLQASDEAAGRRGRVPALRALWQAHGLGGFDKVAFADHYAETLQRLHPGDPAAQPPPAIRSLLETLLAVRNQRES
jgi:hypothetical protein